MIFSPFIDKNLNQNLNRSLFLVLLVMLGGCSDPEPEDEDLKLKTLPEVGTIESIETLFDKDEFENPKMKELLKELNFCSEKTTDTLNYIEPSCSPRFFKFFSLTDKIPVENGFLLQVKSKVSGFPLRRLLIFIRERGQLVKVNGFVANLIGRRKTSGEYDDLLLRFNDNVGGEPAFYNCYFKWNGAKYEFSSVEVIEGPNWGGPVKAEFKDSMSVEIKNVLTKNSMLF